jgi:hypothetical protein
MKITPIQKRIILSTFGFVLGERAVRYTYLKNIQNIYLNGNYFDLISIFYELVFIIGILVFAASIIGFLSIIREIWNDNKELVVRERFVKLLVSSLWTLFFSVILAMIVKILIWP